MKKESKLQRQYRQINEYHKRVYKSYNFRFHKIRDKEVIDELEKQPRKANYIAELVRQKIEQEKRG